MKAAVLGVSVWGPGLEGWQASRAILAGEVPYEPRDAFRDSPAPAPGILGATERRRAGPVVRLALAVAQEAAVASGLAPGSLRSVFGSSNGDGVVVGSILDALARGAPGERVVSPTQFHNSVHNAPAGYWTIAHGSREPATCLGAHDWTWAAGLLKAMVEVETANVERGDIAGGGPVLLCCYDHPLPSPLDVLRPTGAAFGVGLVLGPVGAGQEGGGLPVIDVEWRAGGGVAAALPDGLAALRGANAVAACLPLLVGLASGVGGAHCLAYCDGHLRVELAFADTPRSGGMRAVGEAAR